MTLMSYVMLVVPIIMVIRKIVLILAVQVQYKYFTCVKKLLLASYCYVVWCLCGGY